MTSALAHARAIAARARSLSPPLFGGGNTDEAVAFASHRVKPWLIERRHRQDQAAAAYKPSLHSEQPLVALYANAELGELEADFVEEFVRATDAVMPNSARGFPKLVGAYRADVLDAASADLHEARQLLQACADRAKTAGVAKVGRRCTAALAKLPAAPHAAERPRDEPIRKWIATSEPRACVFAGSLSVSGDLFAGVDDQSAVAHATGARPIEVTELEPAAHNGRTRVTVSWPVHASWWLDATATPFELTAREDVVPRHVWLDPGMAVGARKVVGSRLVITRDFTGGGERAVKPPSFERTLDCSAVRLASDRYRPPKHEGKWSELEPDQVDLLDAPGGKTVAVIEGKGMNNAYVGKHKHGFFHVAGVEIFAFDGWVRQAAIGGKGMGLLVASDAPYTHTVSAELALRLEPRQTAPVVATLAKGAFVQLVASRGGFAEIAINELQATNQSKHFYVEEPAFERAAARQP